MRHLSKYISAALTIIGLAILSNITYATHGITGNGAPNGAHYNLNIIGVSNPKTADMTDSNRHTIFVPLNGKAKILLGESGADAGCPDDGFLVVDGNGTDANGASFCLPNPDPDGDGTTVYSVFARALGKPGGSADMTTCATDPVDGELVCSVITLKLVRDTGRSRFDNVTKYLLYIYADINDDGILERMSLFDDRLIDYFWDYDNHGLKLAQLRFYECATIVPDADDPNGAQLDLDCFSGSH